MALVFRLADVDVMTSELRDLLNASLGAGAELHFYDGTMPAFCEDADDGNLLATCAMNATPFNTTTGNAFPANAISFGGVILTATVTYWRMKSSGGTCVMQGTATAGPTGDIVFDDVNWTDTQTVSITSMDFTFFLQGDP